MKDSSVFNFLVLSALKMFIRIFVMHRFAFLRTGFVIIFGTRFCIRNITRKFGPESKFFMGGGLGNPCFLIRKNALDSFGIGRQNITT